MYFGNISTPRYFDNVTCGGGGCDSFGIRKLKVWVSIGPVRFAETSKIMCGLSSTSKDLQFESNPSSLAQIV